MDQLWISSTDYIDSELIFMLIQTRCCSLRIPQRTCVNAELGNFLSLQNRNCLLQSAAENAACVNKPLECLPNG